MTFLPNKIEMEFCVPTRQIKSPMNMGQWLKSPAYNEYIDFIQQLSSAVKGKDNDFHRSTEAASTERIAAIVENLNRLSKLVEETPAIG